MIFEVSRFLSPAAWLSSGSMRIYSEHAERSGGK
jgi:hypothetical protein